MRRILPALTVRDGRFRKGDNERSVFEYILAFLNVTKCVWTLDEPLRYLCDMLVLLINLARRPDRLTFMQAQLDALGLPFERVDAIDGRDPGFDPGPGFITPVERACALSHRKAWMRLLESSEEQCLILEDDVLLSRETKAWLEALKRPEDADILRLETRLQKSLLGPGHRCGQGGRRFHRLLSVHFGCAAYIVTRGFAERAVRDIGEFQAPVDDVLFAPDRPYYFPSIAYQLRPALCIQTSFYAPLSASVVSVSDLARERSIRLTDLAPSASPAPKPKRSIFEKGLREIRRWKRRALAAASSLRIRLATGRRWRDVPFAGSFAPSVEEAMSGRPGH